MAEYNKTLQSIMGKVTNSTVMSDDRAWTQATLPVKLGGLDVRSAVEVASSAYLASLHATMTLVEAILLLNISSSMASLQGDALSCWSKGHNFQPPDGDDAHRQKSWDQLKVVAAASRLMEGAVDDIDRAHLLASRLKESGAWLCALPILAMGLRLEDDSLRIAVGLHLHGSPLVHRLLSPCLPWAGMGLTVGGVGGDITDMPQ